MDQATHTHGTVEDYIDMWNVEDAVERRALVERVWTSDAQSTDPIADVRGHDAIEQHVKNIRAQFPGHRVARTGAVDQHHDRLRFSWALSDAGGATVMSGIDVVRLAADGRFAELSGYFDAAV
jgi:hypothetical protein